MTWGSRKKKKDKKKAGVETQIDMSKSEERNWIHSKTVELILREFPSGNGFVDVDWSRCYKRAKEEWQTKINEEVDQC